MNSDKEKSEQQTVSKGNISREFLLNRMEKKRVAGDGPQTETLDPSGGAALVGDVVQDDGFRQAVEKRTAAAHRFGVLVVKADTPPREETVQHSDPRGGQATDIAGIVEAIC